MIHRDRPSIRLTADERRQFDELAARLRYELDGASFDPPGGRRPAPGGRRRRAVRLLAAMAGAWWAGPTILILGLLVLGPMVGGWVAVAPPALIPPAAALAGLGGSLTTVDLVRRGRRRARRFPNRSSRLIRPTRSWGRNRRPRNRQPSG